jgi:hypothetical protein
LMPNNAMSNLRTDLEKNYNLFINRERPIAFFKGLAEYLNFVLVTPKLSSVIAQQMTGRRTLYRKIEDTENKILGEMNKAKEKLLRIIKNKKVDVSTFTRYQTSGFNKKTTILDEIKAFEQKKAIGSVFISDEIERYLFDLTANLLKTDYQKELKTFLVSSQDYGDYWSRINGPSQYRITGNENGTFIFSKTRPDRFQQVASFERERILKPWGSFEKILRYNLAHNLVSRGDDSYFESVPDSGLEAEAWFGGVKEKLNIIAMATELQVMTENQLNFNSRVNNNYARKNIDEPEELDIPSFREAVEAVHQILIRSLPPESAAIGGPFDYKKVIDEIMEAGLEDKLTQRILDKVEKVISLNNGNTPDSKWWKKGELPTYNKKDGLILLGGQHCELPLGSNQSVLCDALFDLPLGEWLKDSDVRDNFYKVNESSFYNAMRAINQEVKTKWGITEFLCYEASRVRIKKEIF